MLIDYNIAMLLEMLTHCNIFATTLERFHSGNYGHLTQCNFPLSPGVRILRVSTYGEGIRWFEPSDHLICWPCLPKQEYCVRFIIECSSLRDFGAYVVDLFLYEDF